MKLITDEHRITMLANDQRYAADPSFDQVPVVKIVNPMGAAAWPRYSFKSSETVGQYAADMRLRGSSRA